MSICQQYVICLIWSQINCHKASDFSFCKMVTKVIVRMEKNKYGATNLMPGFLNSLFFQLFILFLDPNVVSLCLCFQLHADISTTLNNMLQREDFIVMMLTQPLDGALIKPICSNAYSKAIALPEKFISLQMWHVFETV